MDKLIDNHQPKAQSIMTTSERELRDEHCNFSSEAGIKMYMDYISNKANAPVTTKPTTSSVFRDIEIEGTRFLGYVDRSGPAIRKVPEHSFRDGGSVSLGYAAEIHYIGSFPDSTNHHFIAREPGWWICKYGPEEPRIKINKLSEIGRHTLAHQFGIPIYPRSDEQSNMGFPVEWKLPKYLHLPNGDILFFFSPSFSDLCAWAQAHPRLARSSQFEELYLRGWKKAVILGEYVPDWQGWTGDTIKGV